MSGSFLYIHSSRTWRVVLGDHNINTQEGREQYKSVSGVYIHPNWNTNNVAAGLVVTGHGLRKHQNTDIYIHTHTHFTKVIKNVKGHVLKYVWYKIYFMWKFHLKGKIHISIFVYKILKNHLLTDKSYDLLLWTHIMNTNWMTHYNIIKAAITTQLTKIVNSYF